MGLARIGTIALFARSLGLATAGLIAITSSVSIFPICDAQAAGAQSLAPLSLIADVDDDDADGKADGTQELLPPAARVDLVALDRFFTGASVHAADSADVVRLIVDGKPFPFDHAIPTPPLLQGVRTGGATLIATKNGESRTLSVRVSAIQMLGAAAGAENVVDMARSHASLARTPPARFDPSSPATSSDPDALRVMIEVPEDVAEAAEVQVESMSQIGVRLDALAHVPLGSLPCAKSGKSRCKVTPPLRFVIDDVDRNHPLVVGRALRAEVGGAILVHLANKRTQAIRVQGPRASSVGPIRRLRATLRAFVLRTSLGGAPAIGGTDAGAVASLRSELGAAAGIWGQCGLSFGDPRTLDVRVTDPPPPHLISIGDDLGFSSSGGEVRIKVDGKAIVVPIPPRASPDRSAFDVARAIERAGFVAIVSGNARIGPGASGSADISVRRRDGGLAIVEPNGPNGTVSTDPTLTIRIGSVDLSDGLQHFTDMDAMAGTLEERTLLKALDDGDPQTLEVVIIPLFAGGGRIGESFIGSDLSSLRNVVILDRGGIRARKSSLTLAHELGHVLMDMPGHPDDYGVDTPTLLMDSDASDASAFGPRRLSVEECARVMRQSGPTARFPILTQYPLAPLPADAKGRPLK